MRIDGYRVLKQTGGQGKYEEAVRFTPRTYSKVTGLRPGQNYKFKIHAKSGQDHLSTHIACAGVGALTRCLSVCSRKRFRDHDAPRTNDQNLSQGKWLLLDTTLYCWYEITCPMGIAIRHKCRNDDTTR